MTYLLLNIAVGALVFTVLGVKRAVPKSPAIVWTLIILLAATAVFDSLIIWAGIVEYDESLILGLRIGAAPVEDFFYAILAAVMVPSIWRLTGGASRE